MTFAEGRNVFPYLLFGWEIATGPFQYMASKEPPDSIGSYAAVYLTQISYLILGVFYFLGILSLALPLIIVITIAMEIYLLKIGFQLEVLERRTSYLPHAANSCGECGNQLDEDSKYCTRCGARVK